MLIPHLILAIEANADRLAAELVADVASNPKTLCLRMMDSAEIEQAARSLYGQLATWLEERRAEDLEESFRSRARRQRKVGIPLSEIIYVVTLFKKHIWDFVKRNAMVDSMSDLYQRDEALILIAEYFDRIIYAAAIGYEQGAERWQDPSPFK